MNKILIALFPLGFSLGAISQSVDFTYQSTNGLYCTPSTIKFTQTCTGDPLGFTWDFGNGQKGYAGIETITYNTPGTYIVKLVASFKNMVLQTSKTIVIHAPVKAVIAADRNYICMPGVINFTGSGSGSIADYQWNFGDGTPLVNSATPNTSHRYANFGTDTVTLRATDSNGCYGDTSMVVSIKKPPITATATPDRGCAPANVSFMGNAEIPLNSSITNYTWDFGDGSPQTVTPNDTTSHNYTIVGFYVPKLLITTSEGCTGTYNFSAVIFGTAPAVTTAYTKKPVICASETAVFVARGTNADRYYWNFGDGSSMSTTDTFVGHKYRTLGVMAVGVTAYNFSCPGVYTRTNITVKGVVSQYTLTNSCTDKKVHSFANKSLGRVSGSIWDFGDGIQLANVNNPVHSYPATGQFLSSLIVNDASTGCADTSTQIINTALPVLTSATNSVCKNDSVTFTITNNYPDTSATYTWNVLGSQTGQDSTGATTVKAITHGSYNNFVVIDRGPQFCPDTVLSAYPFVVKGPGLNFDSPADICFNKPVVITNNSQPFLPADTVTLWYWNYGNSLPNDSIYQPSPFQYTTPGNYKVTLTGIDKNGCKDTLSRAINVNPTPFLSIQPKTDTICAGQTVTLVAVKDEGNVLWSPAGSLSCTVCDTVVAAPLFSSKYYATITNAFNCSFTDSNYIEVLTPFTSTSGNASICSNETVILDAMPKGKKILWSPSATLSDPTVYNPIARPLQSTSYTATLTDSLGCFSSNATFTVTVNPLPVVDAGPDMAYPKGTSFSFTPTYSNNIIAYNWTPPDLLNCSDCAIPTAVANYTQKYMLKVTSDSGCVASDSVTITTECKSSDLYMATAFTPDNNGLNDIYYPMSKNFKSIISFTIYNRQGKIIYSARNFPPNDRSFGWNGMYNGKVQSVDTYIYTLEAICEIGERFFLKGSFVLVR